MNFMHVWSFSDAEPGIKGYASKPLKTSPIREKRYHGENVPQCVTRKNGKYLLNLLHVWEMYRAMRSAELVHKVMGKTRNNWNAKLYSSIPAGTDCG